MTKSTLHTGLAAAMALTLSCAPEVTKDDPVDVSAGTIALFAPDSAEPCNSVLPFPTDLAKDPVTGRLNVPFCATDSAAQTGMKQGLRTLDGYAVGVTLTARFSRALKEESLAAGVKLLDASTGQPVPVVVKFDAAANNTLFIQPQAPLKEQSRYLAVLTTALVDVTGAKVISDQVFTFAKSQTPLVDEQGYSLYSALPDASANGLEGLRKGLAPMFTALEAAGHPRAEIALAWSFTTQSVHSTVKQLAGFVAALPGAQVVRENSIAASVHPLLAAAGIPTDALCQVHSGRVTLRSLLSDSGTFAPGAGGLPAHAPVTVDYALTLPAHNVLGQPVDCATPWDGQRVAVFVHGLGRCKNDGLALANDLAKAGFALLTLDGPRAGTRTVGNLGDQDLDGCADQPATPELVALPGTSPNPFAVRDHLRQWSLEVGQVVSAARARPYEFAGLTAGGPAKVAVIGHSWGGMAAVLAGSVGSADALVVNAASGELGAVFTPALRGSAAAQLAAAGIPLDTAEGKVLLERATGELVSAFRWALEPADPLYAAHAYPAGGHALAQVVSPGAGNPEAPLHESATQSKLVTALEGALEKSTFELPMCDDSKGVVGALLKPCVADKTAPAYQLALLQTAGLRRQLVTFVATAAAGTPVVCPADFTVPCN